MAAPSPASFLIPESLDGARLDHVVAQLLGLSRREARLLIVRGAVRLGGKPVRIHGRVVRAGRAVHIVTDPSQTSAAPPRPNIADSLRILHLERALLVVDKPAGLLSEGDRSGAPSVESILPGLLRGRGERDEVRLVHRLDAPTSGVLIVARTAAAAGWLSEAFRAGTVNKTYWALVGGALPGRREINAPIDRIEGTKHGVRQGGKAAATAIRPLSTAAGEAPVTLVEAKPRTGRTHQIRVHLAHVGHPLLGDRLYGGPMYGGVARTPVPRVMLHARRISVPRPDGGPLAVGAPPPSDFSTLAIGLGIELPAESGDD